MSSDKLYCDQGMRLYEGRLRRGGAIELDFEKFESVKERKGTIHSRQREQSAHVIQYSMCGDWGTWSNKLGVGLNKRVRVMSCRAVLTIWMLCA